MMKDAAKLLAIVACALFLSGAGCGDFDEEIADGKYVFVYTSSIGQYIDATEKAGCDTDCPSIGSLILSFKDTERVIVAMRQIRHDYRCDEGYLAAEITDRVVFQYIDVDRRYLSPELSERELQDAIARNQRLFVGFSLTELMDSAQSIADAHGVSGCTNPKLLQ